MSTHAIIDFGEGIVVYKHFDGYPSAILPALLRSLNPWGGQHAAFFIQGASTADIEILAASEHQKWPYVAWNYRVLYALEQIEISGNGHLCRVPFDIDPTLLGLAAAAAETST